MNDNGNRYALAALKDKRATLAGEIVQLRRQIRARQDALAHVDATLRLLDPNCKIDSIPPKRAVGRVRLFRQGELGRLILGALREADGKALTTEQIVTAVLRAKGAPDAARPTMAPRVRTNLAYLAKRAAVLKSGEGGVAKWHLPPC